MKNHEQMTLVISDVKPGDKMIVASTKRLVDVQDVKTYPNHVLVVSGIGKRPIRRALWFKTTVWRPRVA
jgi:hypothetical protein